MLQRQVEDQNLGSNDREDESEVHPKGLSNYSIQEDAKPETETDVSEGVH